MSRELPYAEKSALPQKLPAETNGLLQKIPYIRSTLAVKHCAAFPYRRQAGLQSYGIVQLKILRLGR
jgi:hypothetical protein